MIAVIERGDGGEFKDRNPSKNADKKLIKEKNKNRKNTGKSERLNALRLAAEKEGRAK